MRGCDSARGPHSGAAVFAAAASAQRVEARLPSDVVSEDEELAPPASETKGLASGSTTPRQRPVSTLQCVALVSVPLLWGTFTPSMKLLLDRHHAPPVILTNLLSHTCGTIALGALWLCEALPRGRCLPEPDAASSEEGAPSRARMAFASCELGIYLFFGQLTQLLGLSGTSATTNAILVQSSVVIVPFIEEMRNEMPSAGRVWRLMPSLLALIGIATITVAPRLLGLDTHSSHASTQPHRQLTDAASSAAAPAELESDDSEESTFGLACSLASAAFYALHTLRLTEYGDVDATVQATGQVAANAALDILALPAAALFGGGGGNAVRWLRHTYYSDGHALRRLGIAAAWNGVFIVGATTWAMSYAQRSFRASTAALAYAMEPMFAALFAAVVLHEHFGWLQIGGGMLVVGANVLVGLRARDE